MDEDWVAEAAERVREVKRTGDIAITSISGGIHTLNW